MCSAFRWSFTSSSRLPVEASAGPRVSRSERSQIKEGEGQKCLFSFGQKQMQDLSFFFYSFNVIRKPVFLLPASFHTLFKKRKEKKKSQHISMPSGPPTLRTAPTWPEADVEEYILVFFVRPVSCTCWPEELLWYLSVNSPITRMNITKLNLLFWFTLECVGSLYVVLQIHQETSYHVVCCTASS